MHEPVLLNEVLEYLNPQDGGVYVDATYGDGGHSQAILNRIGASGKVIGIDLDAQAIKKSKKQKNNNLILVHNNYKHLRKILNNLKINRVDGILLDLGYSSTQVDDLDRGFSFKSQGLLDLRYDPTSDGITGAKILKTYSEKELFKIFKEYGEEPLAYAIAKKINADRSQGQIIETADVLVQLVSKIYKQKFKKPSKINPATRVFQALRIAVNDELGNIKAVLPQAIDVLKPGGRLAVISFHSEEDRLVKRFFKDRTHDDNPLIKIITKKPIVATEREIKDNSRARSAKLRVVEKI